METVLGGMREADTEMERRIATHDRDAEMERQKRDILDTGYWCAIVGLNREQLAELLEKMGLGRFVARARNGEHRFVRYIHADEIAHELKITLETRHPDFRPTRLNRKLADLVKR